MLTKLEIALALKEKIQAGEDFVVIGRWASTVYEENESKELDDLLLRLSSMEIGNNFQFSYSSLAKIVEDIIKQELKVPNSNVSISAIALDQKWLMCPDCIDAWESDSKDAMVICPKCKKIMHNPRYKQMEYWKYD